LSEYYKHPNAKGGVQSKCKTCSRRDSIANRNKNIERYQEYDRRRANEPHRVAARADYSKTQAGMIAHDRARSKWLINNAHKRTDITRRYRAKNPTKARAAELVTNAIRNGTLSRLPCEICGATERVHGHHDDYSKPLDVRWLCSTHHRQWHVENGEGLNPDADLSEYGRKKRSAA